MESGAAIRISNNRADGRVPYKMGGDVAGKPISVSFLWVLWVFGLGGLWARESSPADCCIADLRVGGVDRK